MFRNESNKGSHSADLLDMKRILTEMRNPIQETLDEGKVAGNIRNVKAMKEKGVSKEDALKKAEKMDIPAKVVHDLYKEEVDLDEEWIDVEEAVNMLEEGKSSTGYELYHKDFSSAMKHAYEFAKKKYGITIDSEEIDSKVATGPKKPSEGKTNSYSLKGDKGIVQIQVYNKGGSNPYELNMYKS
jgi:hypothetical protein